MVLIIISDFFWFWFYVRELVFARTVQFRRGEIVAFTPICTHMSESVTFETEIPWSSVGISRCFNGES